MWARLIAIKRHRENRLRAEISRINERISELNAAIGRIDAERAEVIQQWQARSEEQSFCQDNQLNVLRKELSNYFSNDMRLQKERAHWQSEITRLQQQCNELNSTLLVCMKKQEKLRLLAPTQKLTTHSS